MIRKQILGAGHLWDIARLCRVTGKRRAADDHLRVQERDLRLELGRGRCGHLGARAQQPDAGRDDLPVGAVLLFGCNQDARSDQLPSRNPSPDDSES